MKLDWFDHLFRLFLLQERYIEATKDRAADPNPVNEGRCLQLSVLMTIFEWHLPLTRKASLRWHLVAHCKDAEERAEHVEFVINELIPALAVSYETLGRTNYLKLILPYIS